MTRVVSWFVEVDQAGPFKLCRSKSSPYPCAVNIAFIGCQQQANLQRIVDEVHQILICPSTKFIDFG